MEQYISKSALLAEIEKRIEYNTLSYQKDKRPQFSKLGKIMEDEAILSVINTLEVKEVDINKEISQFIDANFEKATIGHKLSLRRVARHFYELGLKAQKGEEV